MSNDTGPGNLREASIVSGVEVDDARHTVPRVVHVVARAPQVARARHCCVVGLRKWSRVEHCVHE